MLTTKQKLSYFWESLLASRQQVQCICCKNSDCKEIDRKYLVTRLMECMNCHLYFRHPVDKKEVNPEFYQTEYQEKDQITTDLPDETSLKELIDSEFRSTSKNAHRFLRLFGNLFPEEKMLRIIDYGSSWGYLGYQFKKAGHQVQGFEISRSRASYGIKNLGMDIQTSEIALRPNNHIFFSSHVIEHHPDIPGMIRVAEKLLINGGYFIAVSPNGSIAYRKNHPEAFHRAWGKVHPNYLNGDFYNYIFQNQPYYVGSSPFRLENIHPLQQESFVDDLSGEELLIIAQLDQTRYPWK